MNNNKGQLVDVTIRKSEKRRRSVLKTFMDGFWLADGQGCLLEVNDAYCRMIGYSESELLTMRIADLDANEKEPDVVKRIKKILAQGADRFETRHRRKDGNLIDVEVTVQYRTYHGGRFIVFLRDITERKRMEDELRKSEHRYSALFANKINAMGHYRIITDEHGRPVDYWILQINEAYERIIGTKKADIEGHRAKEVFPGIENYSFDYIGALGKVALEGGEINFEAFFDAIQKYLSIYAYSPEPGEFTVIFSDITERKRVEEELKRAKEAAEAATIAKSQFLANMSHELRTPMTGVLGMLDLALTGNLEAEQREFIETAQTSARALLIILNDILDMSKIEAGKLTIEEKPFSLKRCVTKALAIITPEARRKGLD